MKPQIVPAIFGNRHAGGIVMILGVVVTVVLALQMKFSVEKDARREFEFHCEEIRRVIVNRLDDHARILQAGSALFNASDEVTREQWRVFNQHQDFDKQLPGIQGVGFSLLIPRAGLERHLAKVRSEGFPQYKVWPDGERELYSSIVYLEPFAGRNLRAFGYDMFAEPVRRTAMEQARDTGAPALSGKVVLVQETDKDLQPGILMYAPVFHKGAGIASVDARRAAIGGWVYSPYRMNDLMSGILGRRLWNEKTQLHLQIFDGERASPQGLLFEDCPADEHRHGVNAWFDRQFAVDFNGHRWTLHFFQKNDGYWAREYLSVWVFFFGGVLVTLLLSALIYSLERTRFNAQRIAEALTVDLRAATERLQLASSAGGVGIWDWDIVNDRLVWDDQMYLLYGLTPAMFGGAYDAWRTGLHPQDLQRSDHEMQMALRGEKEFNTEFRVLWPSGVIRYIRAIAIVRRDASGKPVRMIGTNWDITERKITEEEIRQLNEELRSRVKEGMEELVHVSRVAVLGQIVAALAHELNQPLGAILNWVASAEMALEQPVPDVAMARGILLKIVEADKRAAGVIGKIRGLVKKNASALERLDMDDLARQVVNIVQNDGIMKGATIDIQFTGAGKTVLGDKIQLQQVVLNLIVNALDASTKATIKCVRIRTGVDSNGKVTLSVADSGPGIDMDDAEALFRPFYTTKKEGLGIGLFICRLIIQGHGGDLTVHNNPDGGATFVFALPADKSQEATG